MRIISRKAFLVGSGATLALPFFASLQKLGVAPPAVSAKARRFWRYISEKPAWKKAIVTLAGGDRITLFEVV